MDLTFVALTGTMRICPVCLEQVEQDSDGDDRHWHYGTAVEPVEVEAYPFLSDFESKVGLARFRLQEDQREHDFAEAERRWYDNLSVADRFWEDSRRKRVKREETEARRAETKQRFGSGVLAMEEVLRETWTGATIDTAMQMHRQVFRGYLAYPTADALDDWLASEDGVPQVAEALGLRVSHLDAIGVFRR